MSLPPTHLLFAPAPTITMVQNDVFVNIEALVSDWDAYTFSLDIPSPGKKRVVLRIKHPDLHKYGRPRVREPYAQPIQLENITLEYSQDSDFAQEDLPIKLESEACTVPKVEEGSDSLSIKSEDRADSSALGTVSPSCRVFKEEDSTQGNVKPGPDVSIESDAADRVHSLVSSTIAPLPCRVLIRHTSDPAREGDGPPNSLKYYIRSFNPSILPFEITQRKAGIAVHEEELEWENKHRRLL